MKKTIIAFMLVVVTTFSACNDNSNSNKNAPSVSASDTDTSKMLSTAKYTCTMHPEVISDTPGHCPKCGMKMVPIKDSTSK